MLYHRHSSMSSISGSFNDSCSSGSPRTSPMNSPYVSPGGSPKESLTTQFANSMSLQPPSNQPNKSNSNNTFVHKLYNMVVDNQYQHLIAWNYTGSSFIVCNIMEFSREVLPKHFKHNNFSSFVRQLNMYGFHKVNKSPRGHRTLAENQIWEFSHPKFIKDRPEYLDEIKRKSLETENTRKDHGDINSHMTMMQVSQSEMIQQLVRLQDNFNQVIKELAETKSRQNMQQQVLKNMMDFLTQKHGNQLQMPMDTDQRLTNERPPSIFITSHDYTQPPSTQNYRNLNRNTPALTVQTHNLNHSQLSLSPGLSPMDQQNSPALSAYHTALNTPVSPSPSPFNLDDDIPSLYSPMTPTTFSLNEQQQQQFYSQQPQQSLSPPTFQQPQQQQNTNLMMIDHPSMIQGGITYNQNSFTIGVPQRTG